MIRTISNYLCSCWSPRERKTLDYRKLDIEIAALDQMDAHTLKEKIKDLAKRIQDGDNLKHTPDGHLRSTDGPFHELEVAKDLCTVLVTAKRRVQLSGRKMDAIRDRCYDYITDNENECSLEFSVDVARWGMHRIWEAVEPHFGKNLTHEHFLTVTRSGTTGLHEALVEAANGDTMPWEWLQEHCNIINNLTYDDLAFVSPSGGSVIDLLSDQVCTSTAAWESLCYILSGCRGKPLPLTTALTGENFLPQYKILLQLYSRIADLDIKIQQKKISPDALQQEIAGIKAMADKCEECHHYVACFLEKHHWYVQAFSSYKKVKEAEGLFSDEARFYMASLLMAGRVNTNGDEPSQSDPTAITRALQEALKYTLEPPDVFRDDFTTLTRKIVARLLNDGRDPLDASLDWVVNETDFVILLDTIWEQKAERQLAALSKSSLSD